MEISNLGRVSLFVKRKLLPQQLRRVMKLTAILWTMFCLHGSARSHEQTANFSVKNVPAALMFPGIGKQARVSFFYNYAIIKATNPMTVGTQNAPVADYKGYEHNVLDEMQVKAYGITTQRLKIGDVTTIKDEEIHKQPVDDPLLALEGRVSRFSGLW